MVETNLCDKIVLVTGANHGIGAATARAFAAQGAAVFIQYLRLGGAPYHALTADHVVEAIRQRGGRAESWEADLADPAVIPQLFDRAEAAFGPVEVLVNNAAHWEPTPSFP